MFGDRQHVWRKVLFQYSLIVFNRRILAALAFRNDGFVASSGHY